MNALDPIRARLAKAADGPWIWDEKFDPDKDADSGLALTNAAGVEIIGAYNYHCCAFRDDPTVDEDSAELIANAPTDIARLLAALDDLLYIADNKTADNQIGRWWAATIRGAIEKALGGKS